MNIEVTKDIVKILEQSENPHENEYKITTCYFTFDEFTSSFQVKRAIFTVLSTEEMYETDIINNQCDIPSEVLKHEYETVKLGVYGYNIGENDELLNRFSPSYAEFIVPTGSYKEGALSPEPITPSQYDLYSQALQEGLQEVDDKLDEVVETVDSKLEEVDDKLEVVDGKIQDMDDALDDVDTAITETNNLNLDVSDKVDGDVTVTLTKKDASTKSVVISDGTSLMFNWDGTKLGVKTDEDSEYVYVDLQGIQGVPGPQGEPFRIKKTYSSVAEMNADFNNMQYGDYVMIASTVEIEDNAKLYTRGEYQWIFITDFSGAQGIKGETGATPNIQIGTVTSGSTPSVTRTGTNENPVLNFVLQPGEKGNKGDTGATGNGIASITKTSTSGLVDTYTITYTSGNTTTFNVTNGNGIDHISLTSQSGATKVYTIYFTDGNTTTFTVQDGEVTQEVFDEEVERLKMVYNAMPKVSGEGTDITINNTAECPVYDIELSPSELEQETTSGTNYFDATVIPVDTNIAVTNNGKTITMPVVTSGNGITYTTKMLKELCPTLQVGDTVYLYFTRSNPDYNNLIYLQTISETWNVGSSKTITQNMLNSTVALYGNRYNQGETEQIILTDFRIVKNTTDTWEKFTYGASPNPQYPQEIHTVSGENEVTIYGKNLYNGTNISTNGTFSSNASILLDTFAFDTGTYTISLTNELINTSYLYIGASGSITNNITKEKTFTVSTAGNYDIRYIRRAGTYDNFTSLIQIEKNSSSTPYEPYQSQILPISLGDLEYCKIGDYEDEFYKATESDTGLTAGKWYLKKNIGKVVLTSSQFYEKGTTGTNAYYISTTIANCLNDNSIASSMSNKFGMVAFNNRQNGLDVTYVQDGRLYIRTKNNTLLNWSTNQNCKDWLDANLPIVYYVLATPTYTLLSDTLQTQLDNIQKAISYQDQTNVSQTNADLPFVIKLSAIRDLSGIFELIQ